jgi:hypothetical protein
VRAGDGVDDGDVVLVGDHGVNGEVKIWKGPAEVGKKMDLSLCALDLIGRGIVVYGIG